MVVVTLRTQLHVSLSSGAANVLINWLSGKGYCNIVKYGPILPQTTELQVEWAGLPNWSLTWVCHCQWRLEWLWVA